MLFQLLISPPEIHLTNASHRYVEVLHVSFILVSSIYMHRVCNLTSEVWTFAMRALGSALQRALE
jgi:hypothetical protein